MSRVKDDVQITWQTTEAAGTLIAVPPRQAKLSERLIALREELGLSQEEAVAHTGGAITLRQWQRWESGGSEPYKRNLAKLSEIFDIPISEFFGPSEQGTTQLDRIEAKLDELLAKADRESSLADVLSSTPGDLDERVDEQNVA